MVSRGQEEQFRLKTTTRPLSAGPSSPPSRPSWPGARNWRGEEPLFRPLLSIPASWCGACGGRLTAKRTRRPDGRGTCASFAGDGNGMRHEGGTGRRADRLCPPRAGRVGLPLGAMAAEVLASARPAGRSAGRRLCGRPSAVREARRARALDAFLDGTLSREELAALTARSEAERSRLARRLADLEMAGAERPEPPRRPAGLAGGRAGRGARRCWTRR